MTTTSMLGKFGYTITMSRQQETAQNIVHIMSFRDNNLRPDTRTSIFGLFRQPISPYTIYRLFLETIGGSFGSLRFLLNFGGYILRREQEESPRRISYKLEENRRSEHHSFL